MERLGRGWGGWGGGVQGSGGMAGSWVVSSPNAPCPTPNAQSRMPSAPYRAVCLRAARGEARRQLRRTDAAAAEDAPWLG